LDGRQLAGRAKQLAVKIIAKEAALARLAADKHELL